MASIGCSLMHKWQRSVIDTSRNFLSAKMSCRHLLVRFFALIRTTAWLPHTAAAVVIFRLWPQPCVLQICVPPLVWAWGGFFFFYSQWFLANMQNTPFLQSKEDVDEQNCRQSWVKLFFLFFLLLLCGRGAIIHGCVEWWESLWSALRFSLLQTSVDM